MCQKISTALAPAAIGPYSQAIISDKMIFTSGQLGLRPDTGVLVEGGVQKEAEQALENLSSILRAGGADLTTVVKTTCFLTSMSDFAAFNQVYARYFPQKPARSCFAVKELPKGASVEIEAIAERKSNA